MSRYRCPDCRTRRTSFVHLLRHQREHKHGVCRCIGYHYPHRPGSKCCDLHPQAVVHRARREGLVGEVLRELMLDAALDNKGRPSVVCPF